VSLIVVALLIQLAAAIHTDPRPFVADPTLTPFFAHPPDNGFPSDHTALAATVAFLVLMHRLRTGLVLLAASVIAGAARVAAHVHHVQDIAAGVLIAALAVAVAWAAWHWIRTRLPEQMVDAVVRQRGEAG
jgi:undecaprenyl-diphosphatase